MLDVVAFIQPKSHTFDKCKNLILNIVELTRREDGCLRFEIYQESSQLVLIERWKDQTALDFHYEQSYVLEIFDYYEEALAVPPKIYKLIALPF
jgi:quinol monooxygenase YgiN